MPDVQQTVEDLGKAVKAKYAGAYDDMPDADVGRRVKTKYPGAYDDFAEAPAQQPYAAPKQSPFPNAQAPLSLPAPPPTPQDAAKALVGSHVAEMDRNADFIASRMVPQFAPSGVPAGNLTPIGTQIPQGLLNDQQIAAQNQARRQAMPGAVAPPAPWGAMSPTEAGLRAAAGLDPTRIIPGTADALGGLYGAGKGAVQGNWPQAAAGAHQAIGGAFEAATPFLGEGLVTAPIRTGASLAFGIGAQAAAEKGLKALGMRPEYAAVLGDLTGVFAGIGLHGATTKAKAAIKAKYERTLETRLAEKNGTNTTGQRPGEAPPQAAPPAQPPAAPAQPGAATAGEPKLSNAALLRLIDAEAPGPKRDRYVARAKARGLDVPEGERERKGEPGPEMTALAQYHDLFGEADRHMEAQQQREAKLAKRAGAAPPVVPSEGVPENVARAVEARRNLAKQLFGKEWADVPNSDRTTIDDLIAEGYGHALPERPGEPSKPAGKQEAQKKETKANGKQTQIRADAAAGGRERGQPGKSDEQPQRGGEHPAAVSPADELPAPAAAESAGGAEAPGGTPGPTAVEPEAPGREKPPAEKLSVARAKRIRDLRKAGATYADAVKQADAEGLRLTKEPVTPETPPAAPPKPLTPHIPAQEPPKTPTPEPAQTGAAPAQETGPHGPVLRQFQGDEKGATDALLRQREGEAIGVFHHALAPSIDLPFGEAGETKSKGFGLAKIEKWHREMLYRIQPMLDRAVPDPEHPPNENTIQLIDGDYRAVIRKNWKGSPKTWLLTAFGPQGESEGPSAARTIDVRNAHATERQTPPSGGSDSSVPAAHAQRGDPGWVGNVPTSELHVDAPRFQFKQNVGQGGAGEEFREVGRWDPEKAGVISVWRDPKDGKDYVVNGHHRYEMATRLGAPEMTVRYLDAADAAEARKKGALINIAEGRGEATDAAKVFREMGTGATVEDLKREGISLRGKIAGEGLGVSKLAQPLYDDVMNGELSTARGAIIGHGIEGQPDQIALYEALKAREARGKRLTNAQLEEMIRLASNAPRVTESGDSGQMGMFGEQEIERSLLPEKAEISEYVRKQLGSERKLFALVGNEGAATKLGAAGNVIQAEKNAQIADQAGRVGALYDRLSSLSGDIDNALNAAARRLADGENPNEVKRDAYGQIRESLISQADKLSARPPVAGPGTGGHAPEGTHKVEAVRTGSEPPGEPASPAGSSGVSEAEAPEDEGRLIPGTGASPEGRQRAREERGKLEAEQVTHEIRFGQGPQLDAGKEPIEDSPLFGGPRQAGMFGDETGAISPELLTLGIPKFIERDVAPTLKTVAAGVRDFVHDALTFLTPTLRTKSGEKASLIFRHELGQIARTSDQARAALKDATRYFARQKAEDNYDFIDRMETGRPQKTPALDTIAATLRKLLDERRDAVRALGRGKLQKFYTNYFPHIWKDQRKAESVFAAFFGKRPLEGGKSFLKQRTLPTFADGINRGLEPLSDNPVDLALAKLYEMDRFLMAHRTLGRWKENGLARFVDARKGKAPKGWKKIDDSIGTVYGPSVQNIAEYPNEGLWTGLRDVADALGVKHTRGFKNLGAGVMGRAHRGTPLVETLHATAEDTLAHEIGHQIDWLAGSGKRFVLNYPDPGTVARLKAAYRTIKDKSSTPAERTAARKELKALAPAIAARKQFAQELRDLSDLRAAPQAYRRSREEKMAQLAQMWAGARPLFEKTAPTVFKEWKQFLDENPKLHALRDIEASANKTAIAQPYDVGGLVVRGHYYSPEGAALIMNNYLSPGLRRFAAYRGIAGLNNAMNQFQLGMSAFHLGFVSADAAVSKAALGWQALMRGRPLEAAKHFALTPVSPVTTFLQGAKGLREWEKPGTESPAIGALMDRLVEAGGRSRMDAIYRTDMGKNMAAAFRQGNVIGAALRAPFAATEALSNVLMNEIVPRMKMGAAMDLMKSHLEQMPPDVSWEDASRTLAQDWNSIENRMGEMTYDNLFWNRIAKDVAMLSVRSVGWNLGTLREIGGGIGDLAVQPYNALKGKPVNLNRLSYMLGAVTVNAVMSAVYQYARTGKGPDQLEDYFFPKNGEVDEQGRPQRVSWPTYIKDVYHYGTHPGKTIANKLAPIWSELADMWNNKDFYGDKIRNADDPLVAQLADSAKYLAKQAVPIGVRNFEREKALGASPETKAEQFVGISPAPADLDKTPAERLAADLSAERTGDEPGRPADAADRRALRQSVARALRGGKPIPKEALDAIRAGKLRTQDLKQAFKTAHESPLEAAFNRLTIGDALKVYRAATTDERLRLRGMLVKKGTAAIRMEAPAERLKTAQGIREALAVQ